MASNKGRSTEVDHQQSRPEDQLVWWRYVYLFHIREVARQTVFAATAFHNMQKLLSSAEVRHNQARQAQKKGDQKVLDEALFRLREEGTLFWYHLQAFLTASGNLSKLFWPSRKVAEGRGIWLRGFFNVTDDSPLKNRDLRNHFEHFDERLDQWGSAESAAGFADELVVFPGQLDPVNSGLSPDCCLRVFYVSDMSASFYGERYYLRPIVDEVNRILPVAMEATKVVHDSMQE